MHELVSSRAITPAPATGIGFTPSHRIPCAGGVAGCCCHWTPRRCVAPPEGPTLLVAGTDLQRRQATANVAAQIWCVGWPGPDERIACAWPDVVNKRNAFAEPKMRHYPVYPTTFRVLSLGAALLSGNAIAQQSNATKFKQDFESAKVASNRRSEFKEWTMFDIGDKRIPHYMRLSSIEQFDNKVAFQWRFVPTTSEGLFRGKQFPDGVNVEDLAVFDCTEPTYALSERRITAKSGEVLFHFKWADPHFLIISNGPKLVPDSVAMLARNIACHEELRTPLVDKPDLTSLKFPSLGKTMAGDRDIFYIPIKDGNSTQNQINVTTIIKWHEDRKISTALPSGISIEESSQYRFEITQVRIYCGENKMSFFKKEYYTASTDLVYLAAMDPSRQVPQVHIDEASPYRALRRIVCNFNEVRQ
jgi:hypothetical protein